jgi:hypothetical protein
LEEHHLIIGSVVSYCSAFFNLLRDLLTVGLEDRGKLRAFDCDGFLSV